MKRTVIAGIALGVLIALVATCQPAPDEEPSTPEQDQNIFIVLIDTLRADHMGCYGYHRDTTPNMDMIAKKGIRFSNFYSVSNWTYPTIASLFTGRYPQGVFPPARPREALKYVLPSELDTMAELLGRSGYKTAGLLAHPGLGPSSGYGQGFDEYLMLTKKWGKRKGPTGPWPRVKKEFVRQEVSEFLDGVEGQKFFLYLHVVYPHGPYTPPPPYDSMFGDGPEQTGMREEEKQGLINLYDGEIRYTDDLMGELFEELGGRGLLENTYFFMTSDHGEGFWEHGTSGHGAQLFNEEIRIPLIVHPPGGRSEQLQRVDSYRSNIDLFPTVLELAGVPDPDHVEGTSLVRFLAGQGGAPDENMLFSESAHTIERLSMAIIEDGAKYIHTPGKPQIENRLFDLEADPDEKKNLADRKTDYVRDLRESMRRHIVRNDAERSAIGTEFRELDEETTERLRALGYLE